MTIVRFLLGFPLLVATLGPLELGAATLRRRLLPSRRGADAILVDVVVVLAAVTVIGEVLGTVGWFSLVPILLVSAICGVGAWWGWRPPASPYATVDADPAPSAARPVGRAGLLLIVGGLLLTLGSWVARTLMALSGGIATADSNWYHLPFAARFVQTGRVDDIQALDGGSVTAYFPATSSLWHALGFLWFDSDLLSAVINLGWLSLALLAAWCIGRGFGVAPMAVAAAAIILAGPGMVDTQPGGALNDVVGLALLLAMVAIGLRDVDGDRLWAQYGVAALAGGLATGTKFTLLFPVVAVAGAMIAAAQRGGRVRRGLAMAAGGALSGGYWYVRNAVVAGNPLPAAEIELGPLHLRAVEGVDNASSVSSLLFKGGAWSEFLLPGLRDAYGPAWMVVILLAAVGMVGAVVAGPTRVVRFLGAAAALSTAVFVFTPQYLFGGVFFATNLRYAAPGISLGLVLGSVVLRRWSQWLAVGLGLTLVFTQLDTTSWPFGLGADSFFNPVDRRPAVIAGMLVAVAGIAASALVVLWQRHPPGQRGRWMAAAGGSALVVVALAGVNDRYYESRYEDFGPVPAALRWADTVHDARIGVYGSFLAIKYPFAGADRSNRVTYLAVATPDGGFREPSSCTEWVELLEGEDLDYVLLPTAKGEQAREVRWTADVPGAEQLDSFAVAKSNEAELLLFHLPDELVASGCPT